ncbi:hypothetical protein Droror1_Dr00024058 [Drosera rotundifolia]
MAYDKALEMLHKNRVVLEKIVDELLDLEGLSGKGLEIILVKNAGVQEVEPFGLSKVHKDESDDIRTKGKEIVQPKFEAFKERFNPSRNWAENTSKRWCVEIDHDVREKPIIKELSKNLGARS